MTKTKTAIEKPNTDSAVFSYDADAAQAIPLEITFRGRDRRVIHNLAPLTDARFFQLERERDEAKKRLVKAGGLSTEAYAPNTALWDDLAQSIEGFAPDAEWKTKTHFLDKTNAIGAFLHTAEVEEEDPLDDDLLTFDATFEVKLSVLQSGVLIETTHVFREETKAEFDEYLAIMSSKPRAGALAKFAQVSSAERMTDLYDALTQGASPYVGRVPAWHKLAAVGIHFSRQLARMGKF